MTPPKTSVGRALPLCLLVLAACSACGASETPTAESPTAEPRAPEPRAPEPRAPEPRAPEPRAPEPRAPEPRPAPAPPPDGELNMRFDFAVSPTGAHPAEWRRLVLVYTSSGGPEAMDTGLGGDHCAHDAMLECSWSPSTVRLRASCVAQGTGPEAEVVMDAAGACVLHAREIDRDHASRGVAPEWTVVGAVPCPPPGHPCPDFVR